MNRHSTAAMNAHQRLEAATNLAGLSPISDDIIVACLRERFMTDHVYTNIGSSGVVALNPHKYVASNSDSMLHKYAAEYRDSSEHKEKLPPHVFQIANNAYYHMRRTTQDQCILFRCVVASTPQPRLMLIHPSTAVKLGAESRRTDASLSSPCWSSA